MPVGAEYPKSYTPDGKEIPADQLGAAIQNRNATWAQGTKLPMVAPDGSRYDVPAEHVWNSLDTGWRLESPEETRVRDFEQVSEEHPVLSSIAAGASEAADVASFGQTGVVRALTTPQAAKDIEAIKEANPIATGVGAVGGALLGGGSATGKALKGVAEGVGLGKLMPGLGFLEAGAAGETGALTRAGASATRHGVTGAFEGLGLGAGQEATRQALGDRDFALEKIFAAAGEGAAIGGAAGGLLGGVGRLGGDALGAVGKRFLDADRLALTSVGGTNAQIKKQLQIRGKEEVKRIVGILREEGIITGKKDITEIAEMTAKGREKAGADIGTFLKRVDDLPGYQPNKAKMMGEVAELTGELRSRNVGPDIKLARELEKDWLPALQKADSASELHALRRRFDEHKRAVFESTKDHARDASYKRFRNILESNLETDVERAVARAGDLGETGLVNDYLKLKQRSQAFIVADDMAQEAAARAQAGTGGMGFGDMVRGGLGFAGASMHGLGPAASAAVGLFTDAGYRLAKGRKAAGYMSNALNSVLGGIDATGLKVSNAVGATMARGAQELVQRVPAATGKILTDYEARSQAAREAKSNLPLTMAKTAQVVAPLTDLDPDLGRKGAVKIQDDLAWLTSKLPSPGIPTVFRTKDIPGAGEAGKRGRGRPRGSTGPLARLSPGVAAKFNRYERALNAPAAELSQWGKDGHLAPETIEVLRDRRPGFREQIRNEISVKLSEQAERGTVPSYTARVQLSLATGSPMDPTMTPEFVSNVQSFWAKEREVAAAPPNPPKRETSRRMRERAQSELTAGEAMEEKSNVG